MLRDGLYDKDFVEKWTHGFDELSGYVQEFTPERVEEITWVPAAKLEEAVRIICENAPATLVSSSAGACHATNVGNFQRAVYSIIALTGDLDVAGGLAMGPGRLLGVHCGVSTRGHVRREGPAGYPLRQG